MSAISAAITVIKVTILMPIFVGFCDLISFVFFQEWLFPRRRYSPCVFKEMSLDTDQLYIFF